MAPLVIICIYICNIQANVSVLQFYKSPWHLKLHYDYLPIKTTRQHKTEM